MQKISLQEKELRISASKALFSSGYNCSQAVCGAFADDFYLVLKDEEKNLAEKLKKENKLSTFGMEKEMLLKISSSLGGGFGRQRLICGAINGGGLILGGYLNNGKEESKEDQYKIIKEFTDKFNELNNTIICGELLKNVKNLTQGIKPQQRNEEYYKLRPCAKFVVDAIEIIINIINNNTVNI